MFGRKNAAVNTSQQDIQLLMQAMDGVINGKYDDIDISAFNNTACGEKFNELIHAFKRTNNNFVMRMNDAMRTIGDNSCVKKMLDQVESQTKSVEEMENSSRNLENSIQNISESMSGIQEYSRDVMSTVESSVGNMNDSIQVVNESSDKLLFLNQQVKDFQSKIDKIGEIVDVVKQVAGQSNLLALNASIEAARAGEAGKGFAVVADQVRELSNNTSESAGDIVKYVTELRADINVLVESMNDTTIKLAEGNEKVEHSLKDIEQMGEQMKQISTKIDSVFSDIDSQTQVTKDFNIQVENISESYRILSDDCIKTGTHLFKCGRTIDVCRSDMVRGFSEITQLDWLKVFSIDHFILMWRVYNNAVDFEHLKKTQLNNPTSCKIGKWISAQTDPQLTGSSEFKRVIDTHNNVHKYATRSWEEKDAGNIAGALENFQRTYDAYYEYDRAITALQGRMRQIGFKDETDIFVYQP